MSFFQLGQEVVSSKSAANGGGRPVVQSPSAPRPARAKQRHRCCLGEPLGGPTRCDTPGAGCACRGSQRTTRLEGVLDRRQWSTTRAETKANAPGNESRALNERATDEYSDAFDRQISAPFGPFATRRGGCSGPLSGPHPPKPRRTWRAMRAIANRICETTRVAARYPRIATVFGG